MVQDRNVEALVAVTGVVMTLGTWAFVSGQAAIAAGIAAAISVINFSLSRYSMRKILALQGGRSRAQFGVLYASKFSVLVLVLVFLTRRAGLDMLGLILGFTTLPAAMYALLAAAVWKQIARKKSSP